MTFKPRDPKYYVVGGPVQPARGCYICRAADAELLQRLTDGEFCHVLAQRQSGKTSLAASTASKLRAGGALVALVDLTQASGEDPAENAGRWYYSIAYRIVRELRIRAELQAWWKERGGLTNLQRLREFFLEIVLVETSAPVVIFFDRVEATEGQPFGQDLFAVVRACFDARANDPNFQRLTFGLFGSASPVELVKNVQGSAFEISVDIQLPDFSAQEMAGLMAGLGDPLPEAQAILSRVWTWTRGHPYLSQKVFRGLARRRDDDLTANTVDELVHTQFLAANSLQEEPHLSAIAERLTQDGPGRNARLNLYGRIRKGVEVGYDTASTVQQDLLTTGVVAVSSAGDLRVRNEIYAAVFGTRWVNQNLPYAIRGWVAAAAILAFVLAAPIWYTEYLPRPYVAALSAANQDYPVAEDAYESLHMLPGYAATADRLFIDFLARMSRTADTLPDLMRIYSRVAALPDGEARAEELLADFWERRALRLMHAGDRDRALIAILEALREPNDYRRRLAAELIASDYRSLYGVLHSSAPFVALAADSAAGLVTILDAANRADVWRLDSEAPRLLRSATLVAEEQLELEERRTIGPLRGVPQLLVSVSHARPEQVEIVLRSPAGQQARLSLAEGRPVGDSLLAFGFGDFTQLRGLLSAEQAGNWSIALSDGVQGFTGQLLGWNISETGVTELAAAGTIPQPIPEPRASANAVARLGANGRLGLSWPADVSTQGPILVWDIAGDRVLARIPRGNDFLDARFVVGGERVMTVQARRVTIWDASTGSRLGLIPYDPAAGLPPHVSADGGYLAVRTLQADGSPGIDVWDLERIRMQGGGISAASPGPVAIDPGGRYLASGGNDPWVRVWSLTDGSLLREYEHSAPIRGVKFDPSGQWLATHDLGNTFRLWSMEETQVPLAERHGSGAWFMDFSPDSSTLLVGASDRPYEILQLPEARSVGIFLQHRMMVKPEQVDSVKLMPALLSERNLVITNDAAQSVKLWSIPALQSGAGQGGNALKGWARAALSRDGRRVAVGSVSGDVRVYTSGAPGDIFLGAEENAGLGSAGTEIVSLDFSASGALLASASVDGKVSIWNTSDGVRKDLPILHPDGAAQDLQFFGADNYLLSASGREVQVSELASGNVLARLRIQANRPQVDIAEAANTVFIADDLGGVTSWNWLTGQSDRIVDGVRQIRKVVVTSDGSRLITAGLDRQLVVWDVFSQTPLAQVAAAAGTIDNLWLTADETRLVIQAGPWLQSYALSPTGLSPLKTRMIDSAPAAVQPDERGLAVMVLSQSASRPFLSKLELGSPDTSPLDGAPEELQLYWQDMLRLKIDESGDVVPVVSAPLEILDAG